MVLISLWPFLFAAQPTDFFDGLKKLDGMRWYGLDRTGSG
jgi:hypothetical protein